MSRLEAFVAGWAAHGMPLSAGYEWREGRFILVAVDDRQTAPSGCSIDSLVRTLGRVEEEMQVEIIGNAPVWYRDGDGVPTRVSRPVFRALAREGRVGLDTVVFDLSLTRLEDLRAGRFEGLAREHWHARLVTPRC
jgi:hypothetical protein